MANEAREAEVTELAERTLREHGVRALPVDPVVIAQAKGLTVESLPLSDRMLGFIVQYDGSRFAIGYNARLESHGLKQFTLAHELGHYCLDGHALALIRTGVGLHTCSVEPPGGDPFEKEADWFASDLLMPKAWFRAAAASYPLGKVGVQRMAELCQTSLTATGNRYARLSPMFCIAIRSFGTTVRYGHLSETARNLFPSSNSRYMKDRPIPENSLTYALNTKAPVPIPVDGGEGFLSDWLPDAPKVRVREEVQSLGRFGTLTILTA